MSEKLAQRLFLILIGLFLLVNIATATRYPAVWVDEVQFADPAINLATHHTWTSSVWMVQTTDQFWAGNAPLYSFVLSFWLNAFGVSMLAERCLNYLLFTVLLGLMWLLTKRTGWVASPGWRLVFITILMTAHGLTFCYRTGRYDVLGMVLFAAIALCWTQMRGAIRLAALFTLAALLPFAGLQLIAAAVLFSALLFVTVRRPAIEPLSVIAGGLLTGGALLYSLYAAHGVWHAFRASTAGVGVIGRDLVSKLYDLPHVYMADKSHLLLLAVATLLALVNYRKPSISRNDLLLFGLLCATILPITLQLSAKYPIYYNWMAFMPLAVGVASELSRTNRSKWVSQAAAVLLLIGALVGLPLRLAAIDLNWHRRDPKLIDQFVSQNLSPQDHVVLDFRAYYAAKLHCDAVFAPTYLPVMLATERQAVTALLLRPSDLQLATTYLGSAWHATGRRLSGMQTKPPVLNRVLTDLQQDEASLELYRRIP